MALPLKPTATAIWLITNTTLTFEQIAEFCGISLVEVEAIANEEVATHIMGENPINNGQIDLEELAAAQKDPNRKLQLSSKFVEYLEQANKRGRNYTPRARRGDKPDAIAWFFKFYPTVTDMQLIKLIGTTKKTIASIKDRTHANWQNIRPRDPVLLGLCTQGELDKVLEKLEKASSGRTTSHQDE